MVKKSNNVLLGEWLEKNHYKHSFLAERLGRTEYWVSRVINGHISVHALKDAIMIEELTGINHKNW